MPVESEKTEVSKLGKGVKIWILSTLTFTSLIHLVDAANALLSGNQAQLLQLYPLLNEYLIQIPTDIYLFISATSTFVLWGITSILAFNNPIEAFLNKMLSEAQQQRETEDQALERNSDFFSLMHETIEENSERTGKIYDILRNVRAEVKDIQSIWIRLEH